jgi:hypothetical protein
MGVAKILLKVGQPKIILAQIFEEKILIFFLNNIPNRYLKCREKGRYVELLNAILLQLKCDLILTYDKAADAIYMLSLAAILN